MKTFQEVEQEVGVVIRNHEARKERSRMEGALMVARQVVGKGKRYPTSILNAIKQAPTVSWLEEFLQLMRDGDEKRGLPPMSVPVSTWDRWVDAAEKRAAFITAQEDAVFKPIRD